MGAGAPVSAVRIDPGSDRVMHWRSSCLPVTKPCSLVIHSRSIRALQESSAALPYCSWNKGFQTNRVYQFLANPVLGL